MDSDQKEALLRDVEAGKVDIQDALRQLEGEDDEPPIPGVEVEEPESLPARWRQWWWIPFSVGIAISAAGYGLATLGGWWWICAGPALFVGILIMLVMLATSRSPWVHVRVHTGEDEWPRKIAISLPLPLRPVAWFLRVFGPSIKGFDATGLDEVLLALGDNFDEKTPLTIHVDESENGERVDIVIG